MSPNNFKSIVHSFADKFPYVTMWESIAGDDYLLIGSEKEYGLSFEKAKKYLSDDSIKLIINDSTKFSFDYKYFDLAITYGLFGHIPPKLFKPIFLEIKRITKKGCFLEGKNNGKKITQNHVFTHNYDSIFKKFLI